MRHRQLYTTQDGAFIEYFERWFREMSSHENRLQEVMRSTTEPVLMRTALDVYSQHVQSSADKFFIYISYIEEVASSPPKAIDSTDVRATLEGVHKWLKSDDVFVVDASGNRIKGMIIDANRGALRRYVEEALEEGF